MTAYFNQLSDDRFSGNPPARGPWSEYFCHAGPVAGLVARAFERAVPEKDLTRMTFDLLRPVPLAELRISVEVHRDARSVATATAQVCDKEDRVCVTATSMHLIRTDFAEMPTAPVSPLHRRDAAPGEPPLPRGAHGEPSFADFIEVAYPEGESHEPGPKTVWMKTPPLLANETPSPVQSLCPLADCGNGLSRNAPFEEMGFLNTDLTIHIHCEPRSEWLASETVSHWQDTGIGLAHAVIRDEEGPVAAVLQTLLLRPPPKA